MTKHTMAAQVYPVWEPEQYRRAGPNDLVELRPVPGGHSLFLEKRIIEALVYAIAMHEACHLSGPTGSAKTSLIEALALVPENYLSVCQALGLPTKPVKLYPVEMVTFEAPGELYQRRALSEGTTYDEPSRLVVALEDAERVKEHYAPVIWLREMGRVHSASVQGGLLNLMSTTDIVLPDERRLDGRGIAWVADSNYQAERDATHTLVILDDALKRRFGVNLTLGYLGPEQEIEVLAQIVEKTEGRPADREVIRHVVRLVHVIRRYKEEGHLSSTPPPTIPNCLSMLRMIASMPHMSLQQAANNTLVGNPSRDDQKMFAAVFNEVFGLQEVETEDFTMGNNLF